MTEEFKISFFYQNSPYYARVVKNRSANRIDYAVRPKATFLVREYGKQTLIFKENGVFRCISQVNLHNPDYIQVLINAIKEQDISLDGSMVRL